jgi:hypothetical protein
MISVAEHASLPKCSSSFATEDLHKMDKASFTRIKGPVQKKRLRGEDPFSNEDGFFFCLPGPLME